jgi:8-oxo-dGTP diphosphatase
MDHPACDDKPRFCPRCGGGLESRVVKAGEAERLVCLSCSTVHYLNPKVAACAIFMVNGGIVLLKRAIEPQIGKWVFPGGFVDRGETLQGAAVRETFEEVGSRISVTGILDVYSYAGHGVAVAVYAAEAVGGSLEARDEALEVRAFKPEELPWDDLAFESTRSALKDYLRRFFPRVRVPR